MDNQVLSATNSNQPHFDPQGIVDTILAKVPRERDRRILSDRLGLAGQKRTLEQIGYDFKLTRERIRQIENATLANLKDQVQTGQIDLSQTTRPLVKALSKSGNVSLLRNFARRLFASQAQVKSGPGSRTQQESELIHEAQIAFLARLSPDFVLIEPNNDYHAGIALASHHDVVEVKQHIEALVDSITTQNSPVNSIHLESGHRACIPHRQSGHKHIDNKKHIHGLASLSKKLAHLDGDWGLNHWQSVNPKNIVGKIDIVLRKKQQPMHFSEIARAIQTGPFKRRNVTIQAVHNELIKDDRFVLMARGTYALRDWGYKPGTVADVIEMVLEEAGRPMSRDEIIKAVLKRRAVKDTTISLNLHSKKQFLRNPINKKYSLARA